MFIDEAHVHVKAGDGGNGCIAFRREKFVPRGGPSGGDGGDGGDIYLAANPSMNTLYPLRHQTRFKAGRGEHGLGSNCHGKRGEDLTISLPLGSIVRDEETGEILADLVTEGEVVKIARGETEGGATSISPRPRARPPDSPSRGCPERSALSQSSSSSWPTSRSSGSPTRENPRSSP